MFTGGTGEEESMSPSRRHKQKRHVGVIARHARPRRSTNLPRSRDVVLKTKISMWLICLSASHAGEMSLDRLCSDWRLSGYQPTLTSRTR